MPAVADGARPRLVDDQPHELRCPNVQVILQNGLRRLCAPAGRLSRPWTAAPATCAV